MSRRTVSGLPRDTSLFNKVVAIGLAEESFRIVLQAITPPSA